MSRVQGALITLPALPANGDFEVGIRVILTAGVIAKAGSADVELGTIDRRYISAGVGKSNAASVLARTAEGTAKFIASEAIALTDTVFAAANGKVAASGSVAIGAPLSAAAADGDEIEVLRFGNSSVSAAVGGTTASAFLVDSDLTKPKIELASQTGGTGDFKGTIKPPATLTGNRVYTLPGDANDTLMGVDTVATPTGKKKSVTVDADGATLAVASSGGIYTNVGAVGASVAALPAATVGMIFEFAVGAAQELRIDPNGTETIGLPSTGVQGTAGKYLTADAVGEWVRLVCLVAGTWTAMGYFGTWTAEA